MNEERAPDSRALVDLPAQPAALLFVVLHGEGGEAAQMAPLARALRGQYPQAAIVSLNGPLPADGGFGWFADPAAMEAALPDFIARIRAWAAHFALDWPLVALAGFGQGAMLALEALQAEPALAGRVIAIGGGYLARPEEAPHQVCVHLLHGMADEVHPVRPVVDAARTLVALGADVTADVLPGIGHELHPQLVEKAMEQLRTFVPARLWREAVLAAAEQDRQQKQQ
ncbi:esterase [Pelomonas sp. KK5]|uniref:esterase n=1 Tax=Pelomonas sp. KK5 TaxID=1855730 RepID=UPI001301C95E|nr:esterase [Pelomonas sp. KK5]